MAQRKNLYQALATQAILVFIVCIVILMGFDSKSLSVIWFYLFPKQINPSQIDLLIDLLILV